MFPKNIRIKDPKARAAARRPYCQLCDSWQNIDPPHHIVFRSQGGSDIPENLISLCRGCHNNAHGKGKSKTTTPKEVLYKAREGRE